MFDRDAQCGVVVGGYKYALNYPWNEADGGQCLSQQQVLRGSLNLLTGTEHAQSLAIYR